MPKITYIQPNGTSETLEVANGKSVMEGALYNDVPGIIAECGGACACATCQIYVDPAWADKVDPAGDLETSMTSDMDATMPNLRLSCQIKVTDALDGLVVYVKGSQH